MTRRSRFERIAVEYAAQLTLAKHMENAHEHGVQLEGQLSTMMMRGPDLGAENRVVKNDSLPPGVVMIVPPGCTIDEVVSSLGDRPCVVRYTGVPPTFIQGVDPALDEEPWNPDLSFLPEPPPKPRKLTAEDAAFLREPNEGRAAFYANLVARPPAQNFRIKLT